MKNTRILRASCAAALSTAFFLALAANSRAADLVYKVTLAIDQADLTSTTGPYSLDFLLSAGAGTVLNTVSLSNFQLAGGSFTAGTEGNNGNVTGSLLNATPALSLSNGYPGSLNIDNEDWVGIGAGVTSISFNVDETTRGETGAPDAFSVALLDTNLANISTTSTADSQALIYSTSDFGSIATINSDKGNSSDAGGVTPSVAVVPEPGSVALLLLGVAGLVARRKRSAGVQIA